MLRKPKILLLDEATAALDSVSEREVQKAIDSIQAAAKNTTGRSEKDSVVAPGLITVAIAHRLSAVQNYDKIVCIVGGCVKESGTHAELMVLPRGVYAGPVAVGAGK